MTFIPFFSSEFRCTVPDPLFSHRNPFVNFTIMPWTKANRWSGRHVENIATVPRCRYCSSRSSSFYRNLQYSRSLMDVRLL